MRFFFDHNLSPRLARAVNALLDQPHHQVVALIDKFSADVKDVHWISTLGRESGWVIISGDARITKNPHEREVWQEAKLTTFFLKKGWMNLPPWHQASKLFLWWPDIMEKAERVAPGVGFRVPVKYNGVFEQIL